MGTEITINMRQELFNTLEGDLGDAWVSDDYDRVDDTPEKVIAEAKDSLLCLERAQRGLRIWLARYAR